MKYERKNQIGRNWEMPFPRRKWGLGERSEDQIHKANPLNQWTEVLKGSLPDSRGQVLRLVELLTNNFFLPAM